MNKTNLNIHFNAPSIRFDAWGNLRNTSTQLLNATKEPDRFAVLKKDVESLIDTLRPMEEYMGYPGKGEFERLTGLLYSGDVNAFQQAICTTDDLLESGEYRQTIIERALGSASPEVRYFDVLVVGGSAAAEPEKVRASLDEWRSKDDEFVYGVVVVDSLEDALVAIMLNFNIQACVIHDDLEFASTLELHELDALKENLMASRVDVAYEQLPVQLGEHIRQLRPEIDLFLSTKISPEKMAGEIKSVFNRIFYRYEYSSELHLSIVKAVAARCETPFFDAVKRYSRQPVGTFHALPIARGGSVFQSPWLTDFYEFYGRDIFLAESSATTGGLDSILQPTGTLKRAQEAASRCYGSQRTFFGTAGTSTSNKIVHQAITRPGDIVLLDRSCHESHHFALLLTGASPYYLESYALDKYSISGGVQLSTVKRALFDLARDGLLDKVKMLILTNCTFDGLTYNVQEYMEEILAIKPDIVFLWDEAWFAFARFVPHYRQRTAMHSASVLAQKYASPEYRKRYESYKKSFLAKHPKPDEAWLDQELLPDPYDVHIRVYATQSTHKTLSSFRQGSMIHIYDDLFNERARDQFSKSFLTYSTTSPNYQILASLDASRRQVHLEGYELVQRQIEMAMLIRNTINSHPLLNRYFQALGPGELIPERYRKSGVKSGFKSGDMKAWEAVSRAWDMDDFVLDPCRINVYTAATGINGFELRTKHLADKYNIQVNKTGLNSFCLMTNVGTTRSSVAYLINCLIQIADECEQRDLQFSEAQREKFREQRERVTQLPPLPPFSGFHPSFLLDPRAPAGKMREAFFEGYDSENIEYFTVEKLGEVLESGRQPVGATFIVPVPPGYPMIAPGQLVTTETITFLKALNPNEILGLDPDLGVRVFKESYFKAQTPARRTAARAKKTGAS